MNSPLLIFALLAFLFWMLEQHFPAGEKKLTFWGWCVVIASGLGLLIWVLHCLGVVAKLPACFGG